MSRFEQVLMAVPLAFVRFTALLSNHLHTNFKFCRFNFRKLSCYDKIYTVTAGSSPFWG